MYILPHIFNETTTILTYCRSRRSNNIFSLQWRSRPYPVAG